MATSSDLKDACSSDTDANFTTAGPARANVLLVDDQPAKLLAYESVLSGLGVQCVRAHSGREALQQLLQQEFAVLILDVHMPEMDGFELAALVREHPRFERVPIIFVTAVNVTELDRLRGYEVGAIDYIPVPVAPEVLRSKVALLVELYLKRRELQRINEELKQARARVEVEHTRLLENKDAQLAGVLRHPDQLFIVVRALRDASGVIFDWQYVFINDAGLALFDVPREGIVGKTVREVLPDRADHAAALCARVLETHEPVRYETLLKARHLQVTLYESATDTVVAASVDITERKRAESALRENERRSHALLQEAPVAIGHCSLDGRFEYVNRAFCDLVRYSVEELQQMRWQDVTHPDDVETDAELAQSVLRGELPHYTMEKRYVRKDGSVVWVNLFGNFVFDDAGRPTQGLAVAVDISDYKRSLEALGQSEQRLLLAKSAARLGVYDWDLRNHTLNWDKRLHEIWGTGSQGAVSYDTFLQGVHPDDRAVTQRAVDLALDPQGSGHYSVTYRVINSIDHATRWIEAIGRVTFEHGAPVRFIGIVQEVTERKEAEHRLQESEQRFRNMADHAPVMIWVTDPSAKCVYLNSRWYAFTGQTPQSARDWGWLEAVHPEDRVHARDTFSRASGAQTAFQLEYRLQDHSGRYHWVIDAAAPRLGEGGAFTGYIGSVIEITERKRIEESLRESERRFRELADAMPQIVFTARPDGSTEYLNSRWYELTRAPRGSEDDNGWVAALHPDDRGRCLDAWHNCVRSGMAFQIEYRFNFPYNGGYRWHLTRALPVRDEAGAIVRWYGTSTDIHDLRLAQEALSAADKRKDEFLATLAHELRNPLAPIRSSLDYLRLKSSFDPNLSSALSIIDRQTKVMARLVDDLLDLSRITRGHIALQKERVAIDVPLQAAIDTCRPLFDSRGHELAVRLPSEPIFVEGDVTRLCQVLANLLNNAAKYTAPSGKIEVGVERDEERVRISIRDNGVGIPPDMLESIFDMFVQVEATVHRSHGGLGLGLTLARQLVAMHGGQLTAHSEGPGCGSEFKILFPTVAASADSAAVRQASLFNTGTQRRILLADDNIDAAKTLGALLGLLGHEVHIVHDGIGAVQSFANYHFDIVLLDIGMPVLSGYEAAARIRALPNGKRVGLVAISGWGQESDRRAAHEAGFDHHLTKPVKLEQLEFVLESLPKLAN